MFSVSVDSVSRIWIKPKNHWLAVWVQRLQPFYLRCGDRWYVLCTVPVFELNISLFAPSDSRICTHITFVHHLVLTSWSPSCSDDVNGILSTRQHSSTRDRGGSLISPGTGNICSRFLWPARLNVTGQSASSRVQLTAGRNGHNRHFDRPSLVSSVLRVVCTRKIELYVSWAAYFRGVLPWLAPTDGSETRGFCMPGHDLASDRQGYFVKRPRKNTRTHQIYTKTSWQISTTGSSSNAQQTVLSVLI